MVKQPTVSRRNGVRDFLLVRLSALVLATYVLFLFGYLICQPQLDYVSWKALFSVLPMKVFTLLALTAMLVHGWIGLWTVTTDYLTASHAGPKADVLRLLVQIAMAIAMFVIVIWGIQIIWGN